jgi:hypothetical protein
MMNHKLITMFAGVCSHTYSALEFRSCWYIDISFLDWSTLIVAKISPWLQLDSTNEVIRKNSEMVSSPLSAC